MRPIFFSGPISKILEIPAAVVEIAPYLISLCEGANRAHSQPVQGELSASLANFIRTAGLQGYVLDLILCGPQTRVEFAPPPQAGVDVIEWAERLVVNWLPKAMEPAEALWCFDNIDLGKEIPRFCMFTLFGKEYMQTIADTLAKHKCVLRSVHGGAYAHLGQIEPSTDPYAILHLVPECSRVLIVEGGFPQTYQEIRHAGGTDQRIREIERLTNHYCQVHQGKKKISRFIVTGTEHEVFAAELAKKGFNILPATAGPIPATGESNLPPEIDGGQTGAYTRILKSRTRFTSYLKKFAIIAGSCSALLALFESGMRMEKVFRAERYQAGEAILASYSANRASLETLQLRYGEFFSAVGNRDDVPLYLDAVVQALPERVWLSEIAYRIDRGQRSLEFVGYTDEPPQIAPFLGRLQANKAITGVEQRFIEVIGKDKVAQMTRHTQGAKELTKFKAEAALK